MRSLIRQSVITFSLAVLATPSCFADAMYQFPKPVAEAAVKILKPGDLFISFVPDSEHAPGVFHVFRVKKLAVEEKGSLAQVKLSVVPLIGVVENVSPINAKTACFDTR